MSKTYAIYSLSISIVLAAFFCPITIGRPTDHSCRSAEASWNVTFICPHKGASPQGSGTPVRYSSISSATCGDGEKCFDWWVTGEAPTQCSQTHQGKCCKAHLYYHTKQTYSCQGVGIGTPSTCLPVGQPTNEAGPFTGYKSVDCGDGTNCTGHVPPPN
jgi:hypothetical protein